MEENTTRTNVIFLAFNPLRLKKLTVGDDLPSLVIPFVPFPQYYSGTIMHTSRFLISMKSIHIKTNVIHHSYSSETITQVLALSPQDRLIKNISIIRYQLHLQTDQDKIDVEKKKKVIPQFEHEQIQAENGREYHEGVFFFFFS